MERLLLYPLRYKYSSITNTLINSKRNTVIKFNIEISRKSVNRLRSNGRWFLLKGTHTHSTILSFIEIAQWEMTIKSIFNRRRIDFDLMLSMSNSMLIRLSFLTERWGLLRSLSLSEIYEKKINNICHLFFCKVDIVWVKNYWKLIFVDF